MAYTTQAELIDRYGAEMLVNLTDRGSVATGTIDAATVTQAIADTDARIDAAIRPRYALPLDGVPAPLGDIARAMAIYKLHVYEPSDKIVRDYQQALADLDKIARGQLQLDAAGAEPETTGGQGARYTDRNRDFTDDKMDGFI